MDKKSILFGTCCWLAIAGIIASGVCIAKDVRASVQVDQPPSILVPVDPSYPTQPETPDEPLIPDNDIIYWNGTSDTSWYDFDNKATEYILVTPEQFSGFSQLSNEGESFEGITIKLGADMYFNKSLEGEDLLALTPISYNVTSIGNAFSGVFDGQNYTLNNLYISTDTSSFKKVGLFSWVCNELMNFNVDGIKVFGRGNVGSIVGSGEGCTLGNISVVNADLNVTSSSRVGGLVGFYTCGTNNTIRDCDFSGSISNLDNIIGGSVGGLVGYGQSFSSEALTITDCSSNCNIAGFVGIGGISSYFSANSFNFVNNDITLMVDFDKVLAVPNYDYSYYGFVRLSSLDSGINISNNNLNATFLNVVDDVPVEDLECYYCPGYYNVDSMSYWGVSSNVDESIVCCDNVTTIEVNRRDKGKPLSSSKPAVVSYWNGTSDISWFDRNNIQDYYVITTAEQLAGLAEIVNGGFDFLGVEIYLKSNIYLNDSLEGDSLNIWTPIGGSKPFSGQFIGSGHSINNLYLKDSSYSALFGKLHRANLSDFKLNGVMIEGVSVGSVAYFANYSRLSNIEVSNAKLVASRTAGGLVATTELNYIYDNYCWIGSCSFEGTLTAKGGSSYAGGLVGVGVECGSTMIQYCTVDADISGFSVVGAISSVIAGKSNYFYNNEFNLNVDYLNSNIMTMYATSSAGATWGGYCTFNIHVMVEYESTCYMSSNKLIAVLNNVPIDSNVSDLEFFDMNDFNSSYFVEVAFNYDAKWTKNTHDVTINVISA